MVATVKFLISAQGNIVDGEEGASYDRDPLRKIKLKTDASYEDLLSAICIGVKIDPTTHRINVRHRHPNFVEGRVRYSLVPILDDDDTEDLIEMAENMGEGSIQELYIEIFDRSLALSEHDPAKREIGNVDHSRNLMIHKLSDLTTSPMSPSSVSVKIMNHMDDGNQTSRASSSTIPPLGQDYEVFLSFRGIDTRHSFTDHLYNGLINVGVWVFRDDDELRVGEMIGPELLKAIKDSRISIPIISKSYASSKWCLKELVQILECKESSGQVVLPIFYQVKPSEVQNQTGDFGNGFLQCKKKPNVDRRLVQEWNNALTKVASLKGWESNKIANGHEGELVRLVVQEVLKVLRKVALPISDHLIGVEDHVDKIVGWTRNAKGSSSVQAIVIHGMGGIGKTTLAKIVYNQLSNQFKHCSYVANVRETSLEWKGKEGLQKQLISDIIGKTWPHDIPNVEEGVNVISKRFNCKAVLLLLDDVDQRSQLNALAGKSEWFGSGSIIIITSRNKDVLENWEGVFSYELKGMDPNQSILLFCKHAFKRSDYIPNEYDAIAREIISTTQGLPLAIEVIGSLLYGKGLDIWEEKLKILKEIPHHEVQKQLKISFDALGWNEKEIFLDIACLSMHEERELALYMWDNCGFCPRSGIEKLISMSLLKIGEKNKLLMHDQLRDLGREIVRQESRHNLGKRSRLWKEEEAQEVLKLKQGTSQIQALCLQNDDGVKELHCTSKEFEGMVKLRYLQMKNVFLKGDFENIFLSLSWFKCRSERQYFDIMGINFNPKKLVILELFRSNITEHWNGWSQIKNLKVLKLDGCNDLNTTPDFSAMKKLEVLSLNLCSSLKKIHPSISKLSKTLKVLKVLFCPLEELPIEIGKMEELRELYISYTGIGEIPIMEGYMEKLETLFIDSCDLMCVPDSISSLVKLQELTLQDCCTVEKIPESIGKLTSLTKLDLTGTMVKELPISIGDLYNLEELCMGRTHIECLPPSIGMLSKLQHLVLDRTPIKCIPTSIGMLINLQELDLEFCNELRLLPNLPSSLTSLVFSGVSMETLPDISNLNNLDHLCYIDDFRRRTRALNLGRMSQLKTFFCLGESAEVLDMAPSRNVKLLLELPSSLVDLRVCGCETLQTLPNLSNLKNLSDLRVISCSELVEINGLEGAESLKELWIDSCKKFAKLDGIGTAVKKLHLNSLDALESLPDFSNAKSLNYLSVSKCRNLVEIQGFNGIVSLHSVGIYDCSSLQRIDGIEKLTSLQVLSLQGCSSVERIGGLEKQTSLTQLCLKGCKSLQYLPDLSQFTNLQVLDVTHCEKLTEIRGLKNLTSLVYFCGDGSITLVDVDSTQQQPTLSSFPPALPPPALSTAELHPPPLFTAALPPQVPYSYSPYAWSAQLPLYAEPLPPPSAGSLGSSFEPQGLPLPLTCYSWTPVMPWASPVVGQSSQQQPLPISYPWPPAPPTTILPQEQHQQRWEQPYYVHAPNPPYGYYP